MRYFGLQRYNKVRTYANFLCQSTCFSNILPAKMQKNPIIAHFFLHNSKKSSTFADTNSRRGQFCYRDGFVVERLMTEGVSEINSNNDCGQMFGGHN